MFLPRSPLSEAHKKRFLKSRKKISKNFEKGIDKSIPIVYNIKCSRQRCQRKPRRPSSSNKTKVFNMRKWRNWQTRTFEGRVVHTVRVQVPSSAPEISRWVFPSAYFFVQKTLRVTVAARGSAAYGDLLAGREARESERCSTSRLNITG